MQTSTCRFFVRLALLQPVRILLGCARYFLMVLISDIQWNAIYCAGIVLRRQIILISAFPKHWLQICFGMCRSHGNFASSNVALLLICAPYAISSYPRIQFLECIYFVACGCDVFEFLINIRCFERAANHNNRIRRRRPRADLSRDR